MKTTLAAAALSVCALVAPGLAAEESRVLSFESPADRFELILKGNVGTVNGQPADVTVLKDLLPALTNDVNNPCPDALKGRPDLSVREGASVRRIYIKRGLVAMGENCLNVDGEGLTFSPIHRDFLIGPKQDGVPLKTDLELSRDGVKLLGLKRRGEDWVSDDQTKLPNRDFVDRFVGSLRTFNVRLRAGLAAAEGKRAVTVKSGGRAYAFYKISEVAWALKKPGAKWLVTSDDWSFWYDLDDKTLDDPNAEQIRAAGDQSKSVDERVAALGRLDGAWSPNLRALYHRVVLEVGGDDRLRTIALKRLRRKPSIESAGVMIEVLEGSAGDDVKRDAAVILKLQNPKGPKYNPSASADERAKTIEFWRNWWKKNVG